MSPLNRVASAWQQVGGLALSVQLVFAAHCLPNMPGKDCDVLHLLAAEACTALHNQTHACAMSSAALGLRPSKCGEVLFASL